MIYKIINPLTSEIIYIGYALDMDRAKRALYWAPHAGLASEITSIRLAGRVPVIEEIPDSITDKPRNRVRYWAALHREMGCKLHNPLGRNVPKRAVGRRKERRVATGMFEVEIPDELLEDKTFKEFIDHKQHRYKLVGARLVELLIEKIEHLKWMNS